MANKKNPYLLGMCILFIVLIFMLGSSAIFTKHASHPVIHENLATLKDEASSDTPVETLKTLTAQVSQVQQQNQTLVEQNKALMEQDQKTLAELKSEMMNQVHEQLAAFKTENDALIQDAKKSLVEYPKNPEQLSEIVENAQANSMTWVSDLSQPATLELKELNASKISDNPLPLNVIANLPPKKPIPYYTLPINATLTGAIAMQPIIGRVPIEGKVTDPYTFKVIIGHKNLAANGIDIPPDIQGIVASGVAEGDLLGSCARGEITSMTFVFYDGRISTKQGKAGEALGTIAAANGNPCIAGSFHSNAALYLGAQSLLAGFQGYGNALSQSQLNNTTAPMTGSTISQLIGSSNKYAMGQGFSAAAQSAAQWWNQRVQNSFDFIFVPNIDLNNGKKLELNINIAQEIPIDYDFSKRKVFYTHQENPFTTANLD